MIIHSRLARHASVLLGYFYPALASAKTAVQQDPAAFTQWMTYWVVMSVFAMVEVFVDFFVSWVPFYYEAKIVLIVWLAMPKYQGASQIYQRLLHPYLDKYEGDIDNGLEEMRAGATRRLQSLGASAASEIAKAVSRQGSSAKEVMLARVLGIAAGAGAVDDRPVRSAPPSPVPRRVYEAGMPRESEDEDVMDEDDEEDESAASNASMLADFTEVMKMGVFVQARSSFYSVDGSNTWHPQQIRLLDGANCMTKSDDGPVGGLHRGAGVGGEQRFQVVAAEAGKDASSGQPLLVLRTDRGQVELSPPGRDDRDNMLIGFELLLDSLGAEGGERGGDADGFMKRPSSDGAGDSGHGDRRDRSAARRRSRRWEGRGGTDGMELESSDSGSDSEILHLKTYNGEGAWLCSRCQDKLTMPECEMLASVNGYKNERLPLTRSSSSSSNRATSSLAVARALTPGPTNPEYHAPPRRLFSRRHRCKTRVPNVDFPRWARTSSTCSEDSAPSINSETSERTSEEESMQEENEGAGEASDGGADMLDGLTEAAMQENWTFDECRSRPGLFSYLEIIHHVRFGDQETSVVTEKVIEPYGRENDDSLPWATVHDVEASERARSALCAEIIASVTVNEPPSACSAPSSSSDEDTSNATGEDNATNAGGLLGGLPRLSRRSTIFGVAAVAVGLVAWGASRRR
eukprot:g8283.t1